MEFDYCIGAPKKMRRHFDHFFLLSALLGASCGSVNPISQDSSLEDSSTGPEDSSTGPEDSSTGATQILIHGAIGIFAPSPPVGRVRLSQQHLGMRSGPNCGETICVAGGVTP